MTRSRGYPLDDAATLELQRDVADMVELLLLDLGLHVERHDDGRRVLPALEVVDGDARVVVHVERVIA